MNEKDNDNKGGEGPQAVCNVRDLSGSHKRFVFVMVKVNICRCMKHWEPVSAGFCTIITRVGDFQMPLSYVS